MKPSSGASGAGAGAAAGQISVLHELRNGRSPHQIQMQIPASHSAAAVSENDEFMDQMLSGMPSSWPPDLGYPKAVEAAWGIQAPANGGQKLYEIGLAGKLEEDEEKEAAAEGIDFVPYVDDSLLLAERLRQHQIGAAGRLLPEAKPVMLQLMNQQILLQRLGQSSSNSADLGLFPLPMSLGGGGGGDVGIFQDMGSERLLDGGFSGGSLQRASAAEAVHQQHFQGAPMATQSFAGPVTMQAGVAGHPAAATTAAPPRQKVRARRGQATDPHSVAERLRRERIAERMKALQELVPNANKTDKASMLDEIIDYVKFLQLQVKVLSTSRLTAPVVGETSSEEVDPSGDGQQQQVAVAEQQVVKLMEEEDMGTAMQYLQGKGLCLMPLSLASTISSSARRRHHNQQLAFSTASGAAPSYAGAGCSPPSPGVSVLTVQSSAGPPNREPA